MKAPEGREGLEWVVRKVMWSEVFIFSRELLNLYVN
jgi:hypothetical protein